ncbi:MAG: hypothetical protein R2724_34705 [Bryobacterales bacterium]
MVTTGEREIVDLAIALVDGSDPRLHVRRLVQAHRASGLSAPALAGVQKVLVCGVASALAQGGGAVPPWRAEVPLRFGSATLDLLHWLHAGAVHDPQRALTLRAPLGALEALLAVRAVELVQVAGGQVPAPFAGDAWCWLLAGERLVPPGSARDRSVPAIDWAPVAGSLWLVRALPRRLGRAWRQWLRSLRAADVEGAIAHGEAQEAVVAGFAGACAADPMPLAFLGDLLVEVAALDPGVWAVERGKAPVSRWHRARRAKLAGVRAVGERLLALEAGWRAVGFVDDAFDEVQGYLKRFEGACEAARRLRPVWQAAERLEV